MKYNDNGEWKDVQIKVANAIQNEYGESNNDGYSQNYLNDKVVNVGTSVDNNFRTNIKMPKNLFDKNKIIQNYRISSDGSDFYDTNYSVSLPIKVKPNTKYTISGTSTNVYGCYAFYQSDGTIISRSSFFTTSTTTFTTPSNADYIRIADLKTMIGTVQLEEGDTASSYVSYSPPSIFVDETEIYNKDKIEQYTFGEIKIGTWVDGKPLYRKVINCGALPNNTTKEVYHNISNVNRIVNIYGYAYSSTSTNCVNLPRPSTSITSSIGVLVNPTIIQILTAQDMTIFDESYVVLEYTKTTDTVSTRNLQTRSIHENNDEGEIVRGEEE